MPHRYIVQATALLEAATGALTAIEVGPKCGRNGVVTPVARVSVHVPSARARSATRRLTDMLATARRRRVLPALSVEQEKVRDESWAHAWKRHYTPLHIAPGLFVVPTWEHGFKPPRGSTTLRLDPGMAFGTGHHASTQLAVNLLLPYVRRGATMLDIGCGSGILALAAAQRGARVHASDVDPIAVHATRDNFATNKLAASSILRRRGIPATFPQADIIAANLTARILESLAPALARKLKPGGVLITSGLAERSAPNVLSALARQRLELVEMGRRSQLAFDGAGMASVAGVWRAFVHRKPARP